jgi:hypothetical protein
MQGLRHFTQFDCKPAFAALPIYKSQLVDENPRYRFLYCFKPSNAVLQRGITSPSRTKETDVKGESEYRYELQEVK